MSPTHITRFYCNFLESLLLFTDHVELFAVANVGIFVLPSLAQLGAVEQSRVLWPVPSTRKLTSGAFLPPALPFFNQLFVYVKDFSFYPIEFCSPKSFEVSCHVVYLFGFYFLLTLSAAFSLFTHCLLQKKEGEKIDNNL